MPCLCGCRDDKEYSCPCDERILELEAEVEGLKSFIRGIADTPERSATAEGLFEALERVA